MSRSRMWALVGVLALSLACVGCGGGSGGGGDGGGEQGVTLLPTTLPSGLTGVLYDTTLESSLPNPPGIYLLASGQLPTGLKLDQATGQIYGYPHALGTFRFEIEVRDGPD